MQYLNDDLTQVMGIGHIGEVRQGPGGAVYQWTHGVDGLGNPIGFWKKLKKIGRGIRRVARRAVPLVNRFAPFVPGGSIVSSALRTASPYLRQAGVLGVDGIGALYEAPDGSVYQVAGGVADDDELNGIGDYDGVEGLMGVGYVGEVRQGPDGGVYQWVQGVDGLGNPIGFWKKLRKIGKGLRSFARRAIPIVQKVSAFVPGAGTAVSTALRTASPYLRQAGVLGVDGIGALYEAPDGSVYQVQGLADDDELQGFAADDELAGFAADDELAGFAADDELEGFAADDELEGFADDEAAMHEVSGFEDDIDLNGFADDADVIEGYVRERDGGVGAYQADAPQGTRWFVPPGSAPEVWRPLW
jgi:hypothetical protein